MGFFVSLRVVVDTMLSTDSKIPALTKKAGHGVWSIDMSFLRIPLLAAIALCGCENYINEPREDTLKDKYAISFYVVDADAEAGRLAIQDYYSGRRSDLVCVSYIDQRAYEAFLKIALSGSPSSSGAVSDIMGAMVVRVEQKGGRYLGFGGRHRKQYLSIDPDGAVRNISKKEYHDALLLAYRLVRGPECSDRVAPPL
mgnify:CR=1 FL=1